MTMPQPDAATQSGGSGASSMGANAMCAMMQAMMQAMARAGGASPGGMGAMAMPAPQPAPVPGGDAMQGSSAARLEGRIAIGGFLKRFPGYALVGEPVRGGRARFRGFLSVPVDVTP